ncbi:terminase large subunit domain-containing protein [Sphaerisporangium siamense]|uniref:Terminase n=1 Tax=Sphaerisporangium siamense TaxID=795645 RepID=A0A7W7G7M1_9ACTN|nr:terminase family protein [Sphaerisporangium siamense]MBB4699307.1 hypothetical protein [Sphaerisporangium siamense]
MSSTIWQTPFELREQCAELYGLTCPPRWGPPRRPQFQTMGPRVATVMDRLGYKVMPWQQYVLDVAFELDPDTGLFAYREVGLSIPRQQGKTTIVLGVVVHRLMAWHRQRVIYAAQNRTEAFRRFDEEFVEVLDGSRLAGRFRVRRTTGQEQIIWQDTRSRMGITSNTEKAAHGATLDLGVIDEAFAHEDDRLEQAFVPAQSTRDMAQLWWASAGGTDKSVYLNRKRDRGRELMEALWTEGRHPAVAHFEWYAPDDMPRDKPATWRACMPALGHTVSEATIRGDLDRMDPAEFDRAYLNRTRKKAPPSDPNVPKGKWPGLADRQSQPGVQLALAIEVSHDRAWSSLVVAALRPDGRVHVELVDRRPGTAWVVAAIVRLRRLWDPVAIAIASTGSPAGSLIDDLDAAGVKAPEDKDKPKRGDLIIMRTNDIVEACGQMADAMTQATIVHTDQVDMTSAVTGAMTRPSGDAWVLDRRRSLTDVSPFMGATLARWALLIVGPKVRAPYDPLDSVY